MKRRNGGDLSRRIRKKIYKNVTQPFYRSTDRLGLTQHYAPPINIDTTTGTGGKRLTKSRKKRTSRRKRVRMSRKKRITRKNHAFSK